MTTPAILEDLVEAIRTTAVEDLPALLGRLVELEERARLRLRALPPSIGNDRPMGEDDMLLPAEAAARLRVPVSKVYDLLRAKHLVGIKNGKYWAIPSRALEEYVQARMRAAR